MSHKHLKRHSGEYLSGRPQLMAFALSMLRNHAQAEDVCQEVWLKLIDALEKGREIMDTGKWCRGVARNLILKQWEKQKRAKVIVDSELLDLAEQSFDEIETDDPWWAQRLALKDCMQGLSDVNRSLLHMRYLEGNSIDCICEKQQKTRSAVEKMLTRVLARLRECAGKKIEVQR